MFGVSRGIHGIPLFTPLPSFRCGLIAQVFCKQEKCELHNQ